jgi:hypothetical protein
MRVIRCIQMALVSLLVVACTPPFEGRGASATVTAAPAATATSTTQPTPTPTAAATATSAATLTTTHKGRVITLDAEDLSLNYSQELYWDEEGFAREYEAYAADKASYLEGFVDRLSEKFLESSALEATNWGVSLTSSYERETDEARYLTLIRCQINGAATGTAEKPYFRTEWLLKPLVEKGVDLYDFEYTPDKTGLVYKEETGDIPITIVLRFPEPVDHCHYHIWYEG